MRAFHCCFALLLLLPQCGGGASTGSDAKSAADEGEGRSQRADAGDAEGESDKSESPATSSGPQGPSCDDGTCSLCGGGICPSGWYCDEKASGACSWLAECADKPTCSCVTRVLGAACKCREEGGGLKVACD